MGPRRRQLKHPALEAAHTCRYLDLQPIPEAADRSIVGDLNDEAVLRQALEGIDAVVWAAMGTRPGEGRTTRTSVAMACDVTF